MQQWTARWSRFRYYVTSLLPLLLGVRPSWPLWKLAWVGSSAEPVLVELRRPRRRFLVRTRLDAWILGEVCIDRQYERAGEAVEDGWLVVDVGAGVGEFAIDVALGHPAVVVHAFEPSPAAYDLLLRNIELNAVPNVYAHPIALGGTNREAGLDTSAPSTVLHRLTAEEEPGKNATIRVSCKTLDTVFRELGLEGCDLLKIDCEGGEHELLRSASRETLHKIQRICLEYHDTDGLRHESLTDVLISAGFAVRLTPGPAFSNTGLLYASRR